MSIKFENIVTPSAEQWRIAILGARNPMNSWDRSDSYFDCEYCDICPHRDDNCNPNKSCFKVCIGQNDLELMMKLRNAGSDHRKFMRMLPVIVTIIAPLYWWKEFDTYKVGTVSNSCSTMHKLCHKKFSLDDFSHERLFGDKEVAECARQGVDIDSCDALGCVDANGSPCYFSPEMFLQMTCDMLNCFRKLYLETKDKKYWWQMIQLLPSSYNQKRTIMMNYEVLANIYKSRKNHKLDEWKEHDDETYYGFCDWIKSLPYYELITGEFKD